MLMNIMIAILSRINGKSRQQSNIKWNFEKFLVDRQGNVVKCLDPTVKPEQLEAYIGQLLDK